MKEAILTETINSVSDQAAKSFIKLWAQELQPELVHVYVNTFVKDMKSVRKHLKENYNINLLQLDEISNALDRFIKGSKSKPIGNFIISNYFC